MSSANRGQDRALSPDDEERGEAENHYFPWELEEALRDFVAYCNNERCHESRDNVTPAEVHFGRQYAVLSERAKIKRLTMQRHRKDYLAENAA